MGNVKSKENYIKAIGKGIKKVMSKMGICTYQSYCGAQIFDAIGLSSDFINGYFTGTSSLVEGLGIKDIEIETKARHKEAFKKMPGLENLLDTMNEIFLCTNMYGIVSFLINTVNVYIRNGV